MAINIRKSIRKVTWVYQLYLILRCYEAIEGGLIDAAFLDLTNGASNRIDLIDNPVIREQIING